MNGIDKRFLFLNIDGDSSGVLEPSFEKSEVVLILGSVHKDDDPWYFFIKLFLGFIPRLRSIFVVFIFFVVSIKFPAIEDPTNTMGPEDPTDNANNKKPE